MGTSLPSHQPAIDAVSLGHSPTPELGLLVSTPEGHAGNMSDLRERVPGHALIDELLHQWDLGTIHVDERSNGIVIDEEAEGWYRGVLGERRVAAILDQLSAAQTQSPWTVLHSVPVGRGESDIDHVVIGPPGVFTINTKFSPGKDVWVAGRGMYVGGAKQHYVVNALYEARRASTYLTRRCGLTVPVTGIIVFVDPNRITHKAPAGGGEADPPIKVVRDTELFNALLVRREFSDEQIARIVDAAIRPDTWSDSTTPSTLGTHVAREFQALEQEVGPRLSLPRGVARAGVQSRSRQARPAAARSRQARPPAARSSRRRPKRSRVERLFAELALPIAGLIGIWVWVQMMTAK